MTIATSARTSLVVLSGALMLLGSVAMAQTTTPAQRPATAPATTNPSAAAPAVKPAPNPLAMEDVSKLEGAVVYGGDDKRIGSVSTALMRPENRQLDRLVVSDGGILGIGKHQVALPIENFKWDAQKAVFRVSMTSEDMKNMPAWKDTESASAAPATSEPLSKTAPAAGSGAGSTATPPAPPKPATSQ
ncbi:MAG: PRC-barrel domain-containing protein [Alphaproteobacteria bacterium]|nr:PRC-barrel domain-containing protein [Alphaproteobacteria bacterium]